MVSEINQFIKFSTGWVAEAMCLVAEAMCRVAEAMWLVAEAMCWVDYKDNSATLWPILQAEICKNLS